MVNDATGDFADLGDLPQDYDISLEDTGLKLNLGGLGDEPTDAWRPSCSKGGVKRRLTRRSIASAS